MKVPKNQNEITLPIGAHPLVAQQARAHAKIAATLAQVEFNFTQPEHLLAYLVNAGLAIELYFKALMIAGRTGRVTKGHSLEVLYNEFPEFLRLDIESNYLAGDERRVFEVKMVAITLRNSIPATPQSPVTVPPFMTFPHAIKSLNSVFTDARYFFEKVNTSDWCYFAYSPLAVGAVFNALDKTYEKFIVGSFKS
jgi:hypothetical protein